MLSIVTGTPGEPPGRSGEGPNPTAAVPLNRFTYQDNASRKPRSIVCVGSYPSSR